jgi:hypothetical protein
MPFDNARWQVVVDIAVDTTSRPRLRPEWKLRKAFLIAIAMVIGVPFLSEWIFPKAGIITRLAEGNQIANENRLARRILLGDDRQVLAFTVARTVYHVVSPGHTLSAAERKALFHYAARHHYPRWTADGPFAVDP